MLFFTASDFTFTTRHICNWASFPLWPRCFILSGAISNCPPLFQVAYWTPSNLGSHLPVSYLFAFSYCSWGSHSKNTEVVCHSLLQRTMFCQNSSLWPVHHRWPHTPWLISSMSYTSPFTTTRLWSMKGKQNREPQNKLTHLQFINLWQRRKDYTINER